MAAASSGQTCLISGADEGFKEWANAVHPSHVDRVAISAELQTHAKVVKSAYDEEVRREKGKLCTEGPAHLESGDFNEFAADVYWRPVRAVHKATQDALNALSDAAYQFFAVELAGISASSASATIPITATRGA